MNNTLDNVYGQYDEVSEMLDNLINNVSGSSEITFDDSLIDNPESDPNIGLFTVRSANQVIAEASSRPKPSKLFGQLWWEHGVFILFADTNVGKSILAVQIADGISKERKHQSIY